MIMYKIYMKQKREKDEEPYYLYTNASYFQDFAHFPGVPVNLGNTSRFIHWFLKHLKHLINIYSHDS